MNMSSVIGRTINAVHSWWKRPNAAKEPISYVSSQPAVAAVDKPADPPVQSPVETIICRHFLSIKPRYFLECRSGDGFPLVLQSRKRVQLFSTIGYRGRIYTILMVKRIRPSKTLEWTNSGIPSPI